HFLAAGRPDRALEPLLAAARQHLLWANYDDARQTFEKAAALLEDRSIDDASAYADQADLGIALLEVRRGDYTTAEQHLDAVRSRKRANTRRPALATETLLRAQLAHKRGELERATE